MSSPSKYGLGAVFRRRFLKHLELTRTHSRNVISRFLNHDELRIHLINKLAFSLIWPKDKQITIFVKTLTNCMSKHVCQTIAQCRQCLMKIFNFLIAVSILIYVYFRLHLYSASMYNHHRKNSTYFTDAVKLFY